MENDIYQRLGEILDKIKSLVEVPETSASTHLDLVYHVLLMLDIELDELDDIDKQNEFINIINYIINNVLASDNFSGEVKGAIWSDLTEYMWSMFDMYVKLKITEIIGTVMPKIKDPDEVGIISGLLVKSAIEDDNLMAVSVIMSEQYYRRPLPECMYYIVTHSSSSAVKKKSKEALISLLKDDDLSIASDARVMIDKLEQSKMQ